MILEGLVTTRSPDGRPHLAPMGPRFEADPDRFLLRPFPSSNTYRNLVAHPFGVFHVTDDVLLLARAAVGEAEIPAWRPALRHSGFVLIDACQAMEFEVTAVDTSSERMRLECQIRFRQSLRNFSGFNRAKHAVLELAILCTRLHLIQESEVRAEFKRLAIIVEKTGGPGETAAYAFLLDYFERWRARFEEKS